MNLNAEGCPNMPRNWSEAVPEGNGPVPQLKEFESGQPTLADVYRMLEKIFNRSDRKMDELADKVRKKWQCITGLDEDIWQPRFAMEADG